MDVDNSAVRMTLTGSNVGIGTSSPSAGLEVVTDSGLFNALRLVSNRAYNLSTDVALTFRYLYDSTNYTSGGLIVVAKDNTTISNQSGNMQFYTNNAGTIAERMRITSGGNLMLGYVGSLSDTKLFIAAQSTSSSNYALVCKQSNLTTDLFFIRDDGYIVTGLAALSPYNWAATGTTKVLYVNNNGGIGYSSSNRESKININKIDNANWINELNPVTFNKRKKDEEENFTDEYYDELHYGFIADEMESVNPDFVFYDERNGEKKLAGIHYDRMIAPLVKAIQELTARVQYLENK